MLHTMKVFCFHVPDLFSILPMTSFSYGNELNTVLLLISIHCHQRQNVQKKYMTKFRYTYMTNFLIENSLETGSLPNV